MSSFSAQSEAERLVHTYSDAILRLCYTYLHSTYDAEDICQTVLIKAITQSPKFGSSQQERSWILTCAANAAKDLLRSSARKRQVDLALAGDPEAPPVLDPQGEGDVLAAVQTLPENYREAIYLHYYEGYSIEEISQITGSSASAIGQHLSRGRKKLKELLEGGDNGRALSTAT